MTTTQLTSNSFNDYNVQVSGDNVVWRGWDGNDDEIFLYDGVTTTQLTNNGVEDWGLQISGNNIVWNGGSGFLDLEIFLYDGTSTTQLTNNSSIDISPQISGDNIVWQGWGGGGSEIFLATPVTEPPPPVTEPEHQARKESRLNLDPSKSNLVLATHGYNGDMSWVKGMRDSISNHLSGLPGSAGDDWQVEAYDWTDLAGSPLSLSSPNDALAHAADLGLLDGEVIGQQGYDYVHLIGHSAGSELINKMAKQIRALSPDTQIHTTFLDAYAPGRLTEQYGQHSTWSDHYFNAGDLPWTEADLMFAYDVNVSGLDPTPSPSNPFFGHRWPHEFYQASIDNPLADEYEGFGFARSYEWNPDEAWPPGLGYEAEHAPAIAA